VVVRQARAEEVDQAIGVWRAANRLSPLPQHPERLRRWASGDGARLHVAVEGDRLVGMALSLLGRTEDGAGQVVPGLRHLTGVAVEPSRQREGIASKLLHAVLEEARREDCERVTLWVRTDNHAARRLFASFEFRPTGRSEPDEAGTEMTQLELALRPCA
jgi:ribosomal protein S18 acetylase RimI-like enzyme